MAPLSPEAGMSAIRKCQSANTTKAMLTRKATAVFNGI
jgi:hypothetical protein